MPDSLGYTDSLWFKKNKQKNLHKLLFLSKIQKLFLFLASS